MIFFALLSEIIDFIIAATMTPKKKIPSINPTSINSKTSVLGGFSYFSTLKGVELWQQSPLFALS